MQRNYTSSCASHLPSTEPTTFDDRTSDSTFSSAGVSARSEQCVTSRRGESESQLSAEMSRHAQLEEEQREELSKQRKRHLEEMAELLRTRQLEQERLEEELKEKALRLQVDQQRQQVVLLKCKTFISQYCVFQ